MSRLREITNPGDLHFGITPEKPTVPHESELAKTGPQLLILDDVLVKTDATRQDRVLDFIGNVAQHVQVLIVTCHGERYRGVGTAIGITEAEIT